MEYDSFSSLLIGGLLQATELPRNEAFPGIERWHIPTQVHQYIVSKQREVAEGEFLMSYADGPIRREFINNLWLYRLRYCYFTLIGVLSRGKNYRRRD